MISTTEAYSIILEHLVPFGTENVSLDHATGRVLRQEVYADRDYPPFDRVCMDGIAIPFLAYANGQRSFKIQGTQFAGEVVSTLSQSDQCIEIMTGAVMPLGTDTVIPFEHIEKQGDSYLIKEEVFPKKNIHYQGSDRKTGAKLLSGPAIIGPKEIAVLATQGIQNPVVLTKPKIAVISTGDELVPVNVTPAPHQIRMSNAYMLCAQVQKLGWDASVFHINDDKVILRNKLERIFKEFQIVLFSGGVSKGKSDFVPEILEDLGIQKHFHRVAQRPGKPFWFGSKNDQLVFAFPGNPVSSFVCFIRYFKPWFYATQGLKHPDQFAQLSQNFEFKPALSYFLQVRLKNEGATNMAIPEMGNGSGDFANLLNVDGLLELPADQNMFSKGDIFPYFPF
jgi:molybdopterin molybdotransferase